jgi:hypothetical protein
MPVAAVIQKTFSSWSEYGQNYLIGREFWSYAQTVKDGGYLRSVYQDLLTNTSSPWKMNAWDVDLGVPSESAF